MKPCRIVLAVLSTFILLPLHSVIAQTTLKILIHTDFNREGFDEYLEEYQRLNPGIQFEKQTIPFEDLLKKIQISHLSGNAPDIYHVYALWGAELVHSGLLDSPPDYIMQDVKENYVPVAVDGVTINGAIGGIPTEIDNYCLVYNQRLLQGAGYSEPPKTWDELVSMAKKLTKYNPQGKITQYGFVFLIGWESAVVHPYLSLLWSNGGKFLSDDYSRCLVNSPEGVEALEAQVRLFREKATDAAGSVWDFPNGNIAMMIMAPWYENGLKESMGERFREVGVALIPVLKKPVTALYTWFATVDRKSQHKDEAWKFLYWFTHHKQPATMTTRMGDYLVQQVGALPSRKIDIDNHPKELNDQYTATFVKELKNSIAEPNIVGGAEVKRILMDEIMAAWFGKKPAKQALDDACRKIDPILKEVYHQ